MRLFHRDPNTHAIEDKGVRYEQDEHGAFDLPDELATRLKEGFTHIWTDAAEADDAMRDARRAHAGAKAAKAAEADQAERKPAKQTQTQKQKPAEPDKADATEEQGDDQADEPQDATPGPDGDTNTGTQEVNGDGGTPAPARDASRRASSRKASA